MIRCADPLPGFSGDQSSAIERAKRIQNDRAGRLRERNFDPGFRIALHQKDPSLALQGAKALKVALACLSHVGPALFGGMQFF